MNSFDHNSFDHNSFDHNSLDHDQSPERDVRLDSFLTEFYQQELPDELARVSERAVGSVSAGSVSATTLGASRLGQRGLIGAVIGAVIVAASLLAAFSAFRTQTDPRQPSPSTIAEKNVFPRDDVHRNSGGKPIAVPQPMVEITEAHDYSVSERTVPIERFQYDTRDGPVEQRTDLKTTSVSVFDPQTGAKVEVTLPELTIEIFPIDDDEKGREKGKR